MIRALPLLLVSAAAIPDVGAQQPGVIPDGYRVETVQTPEGRAFGVGGMSFAADGALFVSTREGQVWTLVGDQWQLFADGLHEPLGVYVDPKTRQVFCVQRGELTELIDEDRDGHADRFLDRVCSLWGPRTTTTSMPTGWCATQTGISTAPSTRRSAGPAGRAATSGTSRASTTARWVAPPNTAAGLSGSQMASSSRGRAASLPRGHRLGPRRGAAVHGQPG